MESRNDGFLDAAEEAVAALDYVPMPAALLDQEGTIRWQNQASLSLHGSFVGQQFATSLPAKTREEALRTFSTVLEEGRPEDLAVHMFNAEGEQLLVKARLSVVPIPNGGKAVLVLNLAETIDAEVRRATLSPRQADVLRLLGAGLSTAEISSELALHPTTVRNHIANLLAELGVHSRLQAVVVARNLGLID